MTTLAATPHADVQRAQAGDMQAFAALYVRYRLQVWRQVYHRTGRDADLADDLTADVFVKALTRIGSYTDVGRDFGAWLGTITTNLVADHFKKAHTRRSVTDPEVGVDVAADDRWTDPEWVAVEDARADALYAAVGRLRDVDRQVLGTRFAGGLAPASVADLVGKPVGAVKMLQHRALRALARDERLAQAVAS